MSVRQEARRRRLVARYPLSLAVSVRGKSLPSASCPARNVSVGGMFLSSDTRPELFSELQLAFTLSNGRNVTLAARVVHVLVGQKARELNVAPGFGVQFGALDELQRSALHELVAWARAQDARRRIARVIAGASRGALQQDPMLSFLLDQIDGQRDPEALAEELALDVEMVERMLAELQKRGVIELTSARELGGVRPPTMVPPPRAAAVNVAPAPMPAELARELAELESRLPTADHYQLLGLDRGAGAEEIRTAFQARDKSLHPSLRPPAEAQRLEHVLVRLREAYSALSSPERRAEYDEYLQRRQWLSAAEARISIRPPPGSHEDEAEQEVVIPRHDKALSARDIESAAPATRPPPSAARSSRAQAAKSATPSRSSVSSNAARVEGAADGGASSVGSGSPGAGRGDGAADGGAPSRGSVLPNTARGEGAAGGGATSRGSVLPNAAASGAASRVPSGAVSPTRPPPAVSTPPRSGRPRVGGVSRRGARTRRPSEDLSDMAKAYAVSAEASRPVRASQPPTARMSRPSQADMPRAGAPVRPPPAEQPRAGASVRPPPVEQPRAGASVRPPPVEQPRAGASVRPPPVEQPLSGASVRPPQVGLTSSGAPVRPAQGDAASRSGAPTVPPPRMSRPPLSAARPSQPPGDVKLGAAAQILMQAEAAFAAGNTAEVTRHLKLLSAMTFDDPRVQARFAELKGKVYRTVAVDFEKQAAYEEKQQNWSLAAQSWLRVAEGRPGESLPLQRAALAQLQAGVELRLVMETAKRALELGPNDAQAHRVMAKVYVAADMQANARRELEAAQRCSRGEGGDDLSPTGLLKRLLGRDDKD